MNSYRKVGKQQGDEIATEPSLKVRRESLLTPKCVFNLRRSELEEPKDAAFLSRDITALMSVERYHFQRLRIWPRMSTAEQGERETERERKS